MTIILQYLYLVFVFALVLTTCLIVHHWIQLEIKDFLKSMDTNPDKNNYKEVPISALPSLKETKRKVFQASLVHLLRKRRHG